MSTAVAEAFDRYRVAIEAIGATVCERLVPPASASEIDRLETFLGEPIPNQVRDWFSIANGLDLEKCVGLKWRSCNLFPNLWPRSVSECIDWLEEWDPERARLYPLAPQLFVPIVSDQSKSGAVLLVDIDTGRASSFDAENHEVRSGYYHESLVDFIDGCRRIAEAGLVAVEEGGVNLDDDHFRPGEPRMWDRHVLASFGFDPDRRPPSQLKPRS